MKRVNLPESKINQFKGHWVAIKDKRIIAVSKDRKGIDELTVGTKKHPPQASAFYVPTKEEADWMRPRYSDQNS